MTSGKPTHSERRPGPEAPDASGNPSFGYALPEDSASGETPRHILALAMLGAWALHDVAAFFASSEPALVRSLLPGSVLIVTAGVLLTGVLGARRWLFVAALAAAAALALWPHLAGPSPDGSGDGVVQANWPARLALAAGLVVLFAEPVARALRSRAWEVALLAGIAAPACLWAWRSREFHGVSGGLLVAAGVNLLIGRRAGRSAQDARRASQQRLALLAVVGAALFVAEHQATRLRRPDSAPAARQAAVEEDAPNLLFVVLDTVRADHLAPYGHGWVTTPNLDAFAQAHATRYADARSTSSWTLPSHASLFTGLLPDEHGATRPPVLDADGYAREVDPSALHLQAWPARPLREGTTTLAEILRGRGYRTGAILANSSFLRHEFGLDRGFDHYDDRHSAWMPEYLALAHMVGGGARVGFLPYREARSISDLALHWLDGTAFDPRRRRPFFLFLNYMDAHAPYIPPMAFDGLGAERWPDDPRRPAADLHALLYDRELAYVDRELDRVLEHLEARGVLENTAVVITSDHGEAFGEHGTWLHGWDLHEEVLRVPLYVKPAASAAERFPSPVEERPVHGGEVFSIALGALGLDAPPAEPRIGVEFSAQLHLTEYLIERWRARGVELPGLNQAVWIDGRRKHHFADGAPTASYDLVRDPTEERPLPLDDAGRAELRAVGTKWFQRIRAAERFSEPLPEMLFVPRDERRLMGLGYTGDS